MNVYKTRLKTFSIACENETQYRCTSPRQAIPVLRAIFNDLELDENREHFVVLALNARGMVTGYKVISSGTETNCLVSRSDVYRAAIVLGSVSVLACHNHPSGAIEPSKEDIALTDALREAGEILGVPLADHIILTKDDSYSFRQKQAWDK